MDTNKKDSNKMFTYTDVIDFALFYHTPKNKKKQKYIRKNLEFILNKWHESRYLNGNTSQLDLNCFLEKLGSNIKSISYDTELDRWLVKYKTSFNDDDVSTDDLLEYLENA